MKFTTDKEDSLGLALSHFTGSFFTSVLAQKFLCVFGTRALDEMTCQYDNLFEDFPNDYQELLWQILTISAWKGEYSWQGTMKERTFLSESPSNHYSVSLHSLGYNQNF